MALARLFRVPTPNSRLMMQVDLLTGALYFANFPFDGIHLAALFLELFLEPF